MDIPRNLSTLVFMIAFVATIPQLWHTMRTRDTRAFNGWNLFLNLVTNALLAVHGYMTGDVGILALGAWFAVFWLVLLSYKVREKRRLD
jgi:uncharacterized protein with PQ loop repeat